MQGADLYFSLSEQLVGHIFSKWLDVKIIVTLDMACCHRYHQPMLLYLLSSPASVLTGVVSQKLSNKFVKWLNLRQARVSCLLVDSVGEPSYQQHVEKFGKSIRLLVACNKVDANDQSIHQLIKHCPNLNTLAVERKLPPHVIATLAERALSLPQPVPVDGTLHLHTLHLSTGYEAAATILYNVSPKSLQSLYIDCGEEEDGVWKPLVRLVRSATQLQALHLESDDEERDVMPFLLQLLPLCPQLQHLSLADASLTEVNINTITASVKELKILNLSGSNCDDEQLTLFVEQYKTTLEELYIYNCSQITGCGLNEALESCTKLHTLYFDYDEDLRSDFDSDLLSSLTHIRVQCVPKLLAVLFRSDLQKATCLQQLGLFAPDLSVTSFAPLATCTTLRKVLVCCNKSRATNEQGKLLDMLRGQLPAVGVEWFEHNLMSNFYR